MTVGGRAAQRGATNLFWFLTAQPNSIIELEKTTKDPTRLKAIADIDAILASRR